MTYGSQDLYGVFKVYTKKGVMEFIPHKSGLNYLNLKEHKKNGMAQVTTLRDNFEWYTK